MINLWSRMMKTSLSSLHKCDKCELNFLSKEGMEKHCARVHQVQEKANFNCEQCEDSFKSKSDLVKHRTAARTVGGCVVCQKTGSNPKFSNICELTKHRKSHERKKRSNRNQNKKPENGEIKEKRKSRRSRHGAQDSPTQPNVEIQTSKISNVKKDFKEVNEKEGHMKKKHSNEAEVVDQPENLKKLRLGSQVDIRSSMGSKIVTIEKIPDKAITKTEEILKSDSFLCNSCHKSFPTNQSLMMHKNTHLDEKPFKCTQCEKTFAQKGNLRVHMYRNHGFIEEQKEAENTEEEVIDKVDDSKVEIEEKIVDKVEIIKATSTQHDILPQVGVALLEKTQFHYPTYSWAQLVQRGMIGEEANFMPPVWTEGEVEVGDEEVDMEVDDDEVEDVVVEGTFVQIPPDFAAVQQIIGL